MLHNDFWDETKTPVYRFPAVLQLWSWSAKENSSKDVVNAKTCRAFTAEVFLVLFVKLHWCFLTPTCGRRSCLRREALPQRDLITVLSCSFMRSIIWWTRTESFSPLFRHCDFFTPRWGTGSRRRAWLHIEKSWRKYEPCTGLMGLQWWDSSKTEVAESLVITFILPVVPPFWQVTTDLLCQSAISFPLWYEKGARKAENSMNH